MHIAVLSDHENAGGANIAARRLAEAFVGAGHRVTRIYQVAGHDHDRWDTRIIPSLLATHELPLWRRTAARMIPLPIRRKRHQRHSARVLDEILRDVRPDVVNIHNLHISSWSPEMIQAAASTTPVVCTLHDTWTMTGRCVYPGTCEKYISGCDASCPTADEYPALPRNEIASAWNFRRDLLRDHANVAAVTPSDWLGRVAASGIWGQRQIFKIPLSLDLDRFHPIDRKSARAALGINPAEPIVLVCASELSNPRKGVRLVIEALAKGVGRPIRLILLGSPIQVPAIPNVFVHQLGFISDERRRSTVYNSADLFVHSALEDNAPLTVIESLACGTPVVAFPTGGLPETVLNGQTGWLARGTSADFLRSALHAALADLDRGADLRAGCRRFAESRYEPGDIARQYESVFEHMSRRRPTSVPTIGETAVIAPALHAAGR